jgi:hypothetical protein
LIILSLSRGPGESFELIGAQAPSLVEAHLLMFLLLVGAYPERLI